ncbi:ATP-dependent DNA helicase RecQ [Gracilibacillus orientalis]|uniref:ATP-dependent DNA helicase RecQ n=1 Tax=Gracilibacillus orientalis TaxID=334253 RepID=A0A1I4L068_9BACI|nr:ATP-dependent DNA helicase RecQ [Gracilibacillus orientalis]SFL84408.1 ATP-dependent DNA helicase RecQ [Gracilibacillus orientalis]
MSESQLEQNLQANFGFSTFRPGQKDIIEAVLNKRNVFAVLPTGTGKSLCYQLPAMMLSGTVIVVSPLLSLMTDQVKQLKATGFKKVAALNSMLSYQEREMLLQQIDSYKLLYLSPEMLQSKRIISRIKPLKISLFVVDEAHCISQWGHEFRPDYLRIKQTHQLLHKPPLLALTATATPDVQQDIIQALQVPDVDKFIYPMDKPNISLVVEQVNHVKEKEDKLVEIIQHYPVPTLIYFSSRDEAARVASLLQAKVLDRNIAYYHGGLDNQDRLLIQQQFMNHQLDVICCTNAFGMGINKKDIQLVIHYHFPSQIESFIQEIGRAGRNGQESVSVTLYHEYDRIIPQRLLDTELPDIVVVKQMLRQIYNSDVSYEDVKDEFILKVNGMEPHWRFFRYQLEKLKIIEHEQFNITKISYQDAVIALQKTIEKRYQYKYNKLNEMLQWLHTKGCRRKELFTHFQEHIQEPTNMCCDYCDFQWENWQPVFEQSNDTSQSWQISLKEILYQGE